jgi:predicted NUDIX family phosphoesterase
VGIQVSEEDLETIGILKFNGGVEEVHLGIAMILNVDNDFKINNGELDKLANRRFITLEELRNKTLTMENWSETLFEEYLKNI